MTTRFHFVRVGLALTVSIPSIAKAQFYGDPPDVTHPWAVHDMNRPQPPRVEPGRTPGAPPSDAIVLLDDTRESLNNWEHENAERKSDWIFKDGAMQCSPGAGYIKTKQHFGDCQLHVEWAAPTTVHGDSQGRGNSGIFLMGMTEVQVLDNYNNPTYPDGFAGSVYGVMPPMANALNKPGEWQSYDIVFRRPIVKDGVILDPGSQTVFINGVLVQDSTPLEGGGGHKGRSNPLIDFPEKGPLKIQDHGNPVRFRNIWYRNLRKRATEGGTDGQLSPEATTAKRAEIAATIRKDATTKSGSDKLLRLMESLCYEKDAAAAQETDKLAAQFIASVKSTPADQMESSKGTIMRVSAAMKYMVRFQLLPNDHALATDLAGIITANGWNKK